MSVELRLTTDGVCTCGVPYPTDDPSPSHDHRLMCHWGEIRHPDPRPDRDEIGPLMLTSAEYVAELLADGPQMRRPGRTDSATRTQGPGPHRLFCHSEYQGRRWTWELFDAHWDDGVNNGHTWLIGRWPD